MSCVYKLTAKVAFPEGIAPGGGKSENSRLISVDGNNAPLIRGSSLAGVLRSAYAGKIGKNSDDPAVDKWFGSALEQDIHHVSPVRVADARIEVGKQVSDPTRERLHNRINRHTGAAFNTGLFTVEAVPPGSSAGLSLTLFQDGENEEDCQTMVSCLAGFLAEGLLVGGCSGRGIGRMVLGGPLSLRTYDQEDMNSLAAYLDDEYAEHRDGICFDGDAPALPPSTSDRLTIDLELGIPRGEDLLVGDGGEDGYALVPGSVRFADGTRHWQITGAALRGVFKGWMSRLAARQLAEMDKADSLKKGIESEGSLGRYRILDSIEKWYASEDDADAYTPHLAALGFVEDPEKREHLKKSPQNLKDPIMDLFGSLYKKGRIHFTDFYSGVVAERDLQDRIHVAVDRISGGTHEGALFKTQVLVDPGIKFKGTIIIESPGQEEVGWLNKTLTALDLGLLHLGSSKSAGRLEILCISASGPMAKAVRPTITEEC